MRATREREREREREQTELKEILIEIESLLLQKAFLQNLITQILQKVETPANLESLLDSIPTAYHTKHHTYRPEPLGKVSSNTESRLTIINEANNQSIESDLDSIPTPPPHGWEVKTLGEICEINPKIDFKELTKLEKEVSFLPMEAVKTDGKTFEKLQRKAKEAQGFTKFADNDLLWAKITPCMQNKKSLVVSGLKNGFGFGSTEFFVLRSKDSRQINIHFILQFLRLDLILQNASETFKGSAGQQRVPKEFLQNLKIPLPPLSVQEKILAHIQKIESSIATTQNKAKALELELERYIESTL